MTTPPAGVDFTPEAVEEARSAFVWYQERSELAARAFLSELDQAILRILEAPRTWPRYRSGTRRCLLERFPFSIVYREARGRIEIVLGARIADPEHDRVDDAPEVIAHRACRQPQG